MTKFSSKRPPSSLLIPEKRPLKTSSSVSKTYSSEKYTPNLYFTSSREKQEQDPENKTMDSKEADPTTITTTTEFNFSLPPQPFLDPGVWERIRSSSLSSSSRGGGESGSRMQLNEREREEERRRRRVREAEYGGMAVRGRMR
ncbi:hypothetical protein ASPBRDRAFT_42567 [Aspergillus brasiliensis CBS 101740]|uniref:Uncharacterized protein n=1 Tax=Aspergillus brasiliensis (strain CBS 101740 / IMI 381727 / IBT 21946) TaxID=767769 RepID=A0A1L9UMD3_ASPBC|nr:hypothetical protein ASPBRDRAFT_42567 [Aspergillus brasiliensis CBS 101740]